MAISQDWWDDWWEQDFSWDGLARRPWRGWAVPADGVPVPRGEGVEGRDATLQDYWRRAGLEADIERPEFRCPKTGRRFTRVHLPLHFRDGSETLKGAKDPAFKDSLDEVLSAELDRPIVETEFAPWGDLIGADHRLQWSGAVLASFDLSELSHQTRSDDDRIPISLHASNAAFSGHTYFQSAAFLVDANFESAAFSGDTYFHSAAFSGNAFFQSVVFSGNAYFFRATFSRDAYFYSAAFSGHTYFQNAAFLIDTDFESAAFSGHTDFQSAAFSGYAHFQSVAFSENAAFESAAFSGDAIFQSASFFGVAQFSGEGRSLKSEPVDQAISLKSQSVAEGMELTGQLTGEPSPPSIARRSVKRFDAKEAVFLGPVDFSNRDILNGSTTDESDFHRAHFFHLFKFHGSVLHSGINFGRTHFETALERGKTRDAYLPVPDALIRGLANLKRAIPQKPEPPAEDAPDWKKEHFERDTAKWLALYEYPAEDARSLPAFQTWRKDRARAFAEGPVEDRIEYFRALEDCFRTLKLFNEDRRDRPEEGRFHRLELIARRRRRPNYSLRELFSLKRAKVGIPMWERMMSHIYGWGSNYGNSVVLPIGWLLGGVFAFATLYLLMGDWFVYTPNSARFGEALSFSFGRVFPFGPWDAPEACSAIGQMLDPLTDIGKETCKAQLGEAFEPRTYKGGTPLTLRLLASFQSLSAIILVFLSGLAIRRRFQIN